MKNPARGSVLLTLVVLFGGLFYFQTETVTALVIANDSQEKLQQDKQIRQEKTDIKTNKQEIKEVVTIEIENLTDAKAIELNEKLGSRSFTATAYCLRGKTATGGSVRRGIVAADPRVLPLGTRISMNAGAYSGDYLVADTGGSVKGRKLDIWVPSCSEAKRFGRRTVTVAVLGRKR